MNPSSLAGYFHLFSIDTRNLVFCGKHIFLLEKGKFKGACYLIKIFQG
jgi:hypothetical protein